ncbi:MAG: hypothetical protein IPL61_04605 [Myxococcales bacterium]|nr:hypothetical protein [Myxococcales bacterium]
MGDVRGSRACGARSRPQLGELLVRYLEQVDPPPGCDDGAGDDDDDDDAVARPRPPNGALTIFRLRQQISNQALRGKTATERRLARREAWQAAAASPWLPPRLRLGQLLLALDDAGDDAARAALVTVFTRGRLRWGVWQAAKLIYKRAEARHDALLFGALAYRFDMLGPDPRGYDKDELAPGTILYMKKRAWRWLRHLGQAVPEAYPAFAIEVLRHYRDDAPVRSSWVAAHIWGRKRLRGTKRPVGFRPPALTERAFPDAWKLTPAPLVRLLLEAGHREVAGWAIAALEADHPTALHALTPAQLAALGRRGADGPVAAFVVKLLRARPDLHASQYRALGLHEVVLDFLRSRDAGVAGFAIAYARTHAADLEVERLVALAIDGHADVVAFALDRLGALPTTTIGLPGLVRLIRVPAARALAIAKLREGARPADLAVELFVALATGGYDQLQFVIGWYSDAGVTIPAGHWIATLADPACDRAVRKRALEELGRRPGAELTARWLQQALEDRALTDAVAGWLEAGKLAGDALDVDWVKGLVARPRLRPLALRLLGNRALVAPGRIGLGWLLELARSTEPDLHGFAHRLLLEHFTPEDFAPAGGGRTAGLARLWELAAGAGSAEPVREFASTYLRAHHPVLGRELAEAKAVGLTPRLTHDDYPAARIVPLTRDARADVRKLGCAIAAEEIVRWGDRALPYQLATSDHREPRALGNELLLGAIAAGDGQLPGDWLDGGRVFALAECPHKGTREAALTIIRRAYDRVGGRARLAWLMESAERDVRLFAVRLFWDRHRPRTTPAEWTPARGPSAAAVAVAEPLADGEAEIAALRQFVRTVLFGLPPGRLEKREPLAGVKPERPLPASVAKRRLIEAVRDLAVREVGFAALVAPVLGEVAASVARGEWQAAVAALAAIRQAHPGLGTLGLPAPRLRPAHPARRPA